MATETVVGNEGIGIASNGVGGCGNTHGDTAHLDGIVLDGLLAGVVIDDVESRNGKTVDNDREENEPVDGRTHSANKVGLLRITLTIMREQVTSVLNVENSASTDRTEVSHEDSLLPAGANVGHELVEGQDGRKTTEDEDEETKTEKAREGDAGTGGVVEALPGKDGTDVHEAAEVEDDVHARVDFVVTGFGLAEIVAVPVKGATGDEAGEEIVGSDGTAAADEEEAECHGEQNVGLVVNKFAMTILV